ncbi:MAG: MarR family winged helix-turn-helix transcriptional regulator [Rhizobiaceae bacterium]|nr:MarR family winged helix-turn-helix transcriptional regulator [Rhizobiaceae bacterium]
MKKATGNISNEEFEHLRQTNLGRLIDDLHFYFERQALEYLRDAGFPMIKSADVHVMRTMRIEGSRITDMANQAGISKQAMSKLVAAFVSNGFLAWANDPKDKRNHIVSVTDSGKDLLTNGIAALHQTEKDIADIIGTGELENLRQILLKIKQAKNIRPATRRSRDRKRRI